MTFFTIKYLAFLQSIFNAKFSKILHYDNVSHLQPWNFDTPKEKFEIMKIFPFLSKKIIKSRQCN